MTEGALLVERHIEAPPEVVYRYLTESDLWARWQGDSATVEPTPGGLFEMRMGNGMVARGEFIELVQDYRVVFTWGWVDRPDIPPGSTTVEVELIPEGLGTRVRLTHRDLPVEEKATHRTGWLHYVERLGRVSEGGDPGPDPGPG